MSYLYLNVFLIDDKLPNLTNQVFFRYFMPRIRPESASILDPDPGRKIAIPDKDPKHDSRPFRPCLCYLCVRLQKLQGIN